MDIQGQKNRACFSKVELPEAWTLPPRASQEGEVGSGLSPGRGSGTSVALAASGGGRQPHVSALSPGRPEIRRPISRLNQLRHRDVVSHSRSPLQEVTGLDGSPRAPTPALGPLRTPCCLFEERCFGCGVNEMRGAGLKVICGAWLGLCGGPVVCLGRFNRRMM